MSWKKYVNVINVLLLATAVTLVLFGYRWYFERAPIGAPEEYQNLDSIYPTYEENSTFIIDHTNIDSLLGHTGDGSSWSSPYIFEMALLNDYFDDEGYITLSVYNVSYLIIQLVRFELDSLSDVDGLVLSECDNVTVKDCFFMNYDEAIQITDCDDITINNNTLYQNFNAIHTESSPDLNISDNLIVDNENGIWLKQSNSALVRGNTVVNNGRSIHFEASDGGEIIYNNIMYSRDSGAVFLDDSSGSNTIDYNTITDCVFSWISEEAPGINSIGVNNSVSYSMKTIGLILLLSAAAPALTLITLLIRAAVKQRSVTKHFKKTKKPGEFWVFFSYATVNSKMYRIPELAKRLEIYEDINEVFYWEQKMTDDIFEYMEKYIKDCDVILLFCSPDATASEAVKKEWMSSLKLEKKMIPIFKDPIDIPALLTTKLGVQFNPDDFDKFVNDVYALIKKKTQEV